MSKRVKKVSFRTKERMYKIEIARLTDQVDTLRCLRESDKLEKDKLQKQLQDSKIIGSERLIKEIQLSLTANAHALEAIAKIAQPGIF